MNEIEQRGSLRLIWSILVEDAGANPSVDERISFIHAHMDSAYPATEWRFQGLLGFGGKFKRNDGRFYIQCYREDETTARLEIIRKVNEKLAQIPFWMP